MKKLIQQNRQSDYLKIYLSILKTLKPNHNSTTKQHEILVISIILQVFKTNLIDPVDKLPTLPKTAFKIVQILLGFFNDVSQTVQQACARVLLDLNYFCLEQGKYDKQQKISILFTPLISILKNGVDKASQATSSVCINELIKFWYKNSERDYLQLISKDMFQILLKINSQYQDIFMATLIMIQYKGLPFFENKLSHFIAKILAIINGTKEGVNNINSYMCKVNVCKIIQKIALLLSAQQRTKLMDLNVIQSLQKAARNKIIQVQMAATRALKAWNGNPLPQQRNQRRSNSYGKSLRSLEQLRDQKKRQRSGSKEHTIKIQNQLNYMKEDLQKLVKGGWGANNRAKNFVKRGTGAGGGHYGQTQNCTPPKNTKSHRQHLEELREVIKKGSKQNKHLDKFEQINKFANQTRQNNMIPTNSNNNVYQNKNFQKGSNQKILNNNQGSSKNLNQNSHQFTIEQDNGDQLISFKPKIKNQKNSLNQNIISVKSSLKQYSQQSNSQINNVKITYQQQKQLLEHQKSLMDHYEKHQKQIDFYGEDKKPRKYSQPVQNQKKQFKKQKQNKNKKQKYQNPNINKIQQLNNYKKNINQINNNNKNSNDNIIMNKNKQMINEVQKRKTDRLSKLKDLTPMISQQELNQLMEQNNLSQVSQNLDNVLSASDYNIVLGQYVNKDEIKLGDSINIENLKNSQQKRMEDSLNYTESRFSKFNQITPQNQKTPIMSIPKSQQFTLNPNINPNKFQSLYQHNQAQYNQQVQQEIYESCFQQSKPKDQNFLPINAKTSPTVDQNSWRKYTVPQVVNDINTKKIKQQTQDSQEMSKNYQQLIQHPPTLLPKHIDKKSILEPSRVVSQVKENVVDNNSQQQEKLSVTDQWLRILNLVQNDQINQAFELAFQLDDPIYLIRLLIITKTPISQLTAGNNNELWHRFLDIYKHNFISILFVQIFSQANELNMIKNALTIQQMHELLLKLYQVSGNSKGKLSFNAAVLYNNIDENLKNKRQ